MNLFKKKREIAICGTGNGLEMFTYDRETWAVAKLIMTPKPQWRMDKLFCLDEPDTMLSTRKGYTKEQYVEKLQEFETETAKFVAEMKQHASTDEFEKKDKDGQPLYNIHKASVDSENLYKHITELTKIREGMHFQNKFTREQFIEAINSRRIPFITQRIHPAIVFSEAFPLKEICHKYGTPYFTNTICYMIAYAMFTGVTHIQLWGVVQGGYQEYLKERKGVEYWLGRAAGEGIKIEVRGISQLFVNDEGKLYGYHKSPQEMGV